MYFFRKKNKKKEDTAHKFSFNSTQVGLLMVFFQTVTKHFELNRKFRAVVEYDPEYPVTKVEVFYD